MRSPVNSIRRQGLRRPVFGLLSAGMLLASSTPSPAADPAASCQASKLGSSARYAQCRLKADSKAAKTGDAADYSKCNLDRFSDAETKAIDAGGACPTSTDATTVATYVNDCTARVATWLGGGSGLPDTCAADLATCEDDLVTCDDGLAACEAGPDAQPLKSGQTTCFDAVYSATACAGTGQDGDALAGVSRDCTDNGDGTITDNATGLMWEKLDDSNLGGVAGVHDWSKQYTWSGAFVKINDLNLISFAGHSDWRLPNVMELQSIHDFGAFNPPVQGVFHTACASGCTGTTCSCTPSGGHWTSTTTHYNPFYAWIADFYTGATNADHKSSIYHVRAVRGGS